jgi:hypothetical protein
MLAGTLARRAFLRSATAVTAASVFAASLEVGELYGRSAAGFLGLLKATGLHATTGPSARALLAGAAHTCGMDTHMDACAL